MEPSLSTWSLVKSITNQDILKMIWLHNIFTTFRVRLKTQVSRTELRPVEVNKTVKLPPAPLLFIPRFSRSILRLNACAVKRESNKWTAVAAKAKRSVLANKRDLEFP